MNIFKLYLGHNNETKKAYKKSLVSQMVSLFFKGFTLQEVSGYYEGKSEETYLIEIIAQPEEVQKIYLLKQALKERFNQESVLLTSQAENGEFSAEF